MTEVEDWTKLLYVSTVVLLILSFVSVLAGSVIGMLICTPLLIFFYVLLISSY